LIDAEVMSATYPCLTLRLPDSIAAVVRSVLEKNAEASNKDEEMNDLAITVERDLSESSDFYYFILNEVEYPALVTS
jgi:hypothetical protein